MSTTTSSIRPYSMCYFPLCEPGKFLKLAFKPTVWPETCLARELGRSIKTKNPMNCLV